MAALAAIIGLIGVAPSLAQSNDEGIEYVIVANKELPGDAIKVETLKVVYQREAKTWKNSDSEVVPVDLVTANKFYQNLFGKTYTQMQMQWIKMRSDYSMNLPVFVKDAEGVKQFIASNKDAIGFLKKSDVDERVKIIKLVN